MQGYKWSVQNYIPNQNFAWINSSSAFLLYSFKLVWTKRPLFCNCPTKTLTFANCSTYQKNRLVILVIIIIVSCVSFWHAIHAILYLTKYLTWYTRHRTNSSCPVWRKIEVVVKRTTPRMNGVSIMKLIILKN